MSMLTSPKYKGDHELEWTLMILRRFQQSHYLIEGPLVPKEENFEEKSVEDQEEEEDIMTNQGIIGISNDRAKSIRGCAFLSQCQK